MAKTQVDTKDAKPSSKRADGSTGSIETAEGALAMGHHLPLPHGGQAELVPIRSASGQFYYQDEDRDDSDEETAEHILLGRQVGVVGLAAQTRDAQLATTHSSLTAAPLTLQGTEENLTILTANMRSSVDPSADPANGVGAFGQSVEPLVPNTPLDLSADRDTGYSDVYRAPPHKIDGGAVWSSVSGANGDNTDNTIDGSSSNDVISGFGGDDVISGLGGDDALSGDIGDDVLNGNTGNDSLYGGGGHDVLNGGNGSDRLEGGDGDDVLAGGAGTDGFFGGNGRDMVDYSYSSGDWKIDLSGGLATSLQGTVLEGLHSIENAKGGSGDDVLIADEAGSWLFGENGNDHLTGGGFNDWLEGGHGRDDVRGMGGDDLIDAGTGNDVVRDGTGQDVVYLGSGDDEFIWNGGTDEVHGGSGANHYTIERWVDIDGGPVSKANAEDINTGGGFLTIHDFDADDTLSISHLVDLNHFGFSDGAIFNPDSNGDGGVDRYDEDVRLIDGDLHIELVHGIFSVQAPAANTEYGPIEAWQGAVVFEDAALVLTNTDFVDMDQFVF
ncbi:MAG: calcium-binding protein [Pseudomonadota bacterium]